MKAARLLAEANTAGVTVQLEPDGRVRLAAERVLPAHLLTELRLRKPEVAALLRGERCRCRDEPIDWRQPGAITFSDGQVGSPGGPSPRLGAAEGRDHD